MYASCPHFVQVVCFALSSGWVVVGLSCSFTALTGETLFLCVCSDVKRNDRNWKTTTYITSFFFVVLGKGIAET